MNIPTAKEARAIVERGEFEKAKKQMAEVEAAINNAIGGGLFAVSGEGHLCLPVVKKLQEIGYRPANDSHRNEQTWSISW